LGEKIIARRRAGGFKKPVFLEHELISELTSGEVFEQCVIGDHIKGFELQSLILATWQAWDRRGRARRGDRSIGPLRLAATRVLAAPLGHVTEFREVLVHGLAGVWSFFASSWM